MKAEKEEIAEEPFVIRPYLKSELAHLYNPYVPLVYAMRKMREWIRNNKEYMTQCIAAAKERTTTLTAQDRYDSS